MAQDVIIVNETKMAEELEALQRHCRRRTMDADDVRAYLARAEETMAEAGLPPSLWAGAEVTVGEYDSVCKAYVNKAYGLPDGTRVTLRRTHTKRWRYVSCRRGDYHTGNVIWYTAEQEEEVRRRALERACRF